MTMTAVFDVREPGDPPARERDRVEAAAHVRLGLPIAGEQLDLVPSSVWYGPALGGHQEQELLAFLGTHNGVAVLQWPRDEDEIPALARVGLPRLLLVHPGASRVPADSPLQTSLPSAAEPDRIHRALLTLCRQAGKRRASEGPPLLTDDGWVCTGAGKVELAPDAHRLAAPLLAHFGRPVDDTVLALGEGPNGPGLFPLHGRVARLRRHVNPLGLDVAIVPGDAHFMHWCAA